MKVGISFGLESLFGVGKYFFNRRVSNKTWLRALYGEINLNLDIIGALNLDYFTDKKINDRVFREVAGSLQTSVAEAILFDDEVNKQSDILNLLQQKGIISGLEQLFKIKNGEEVDISGKKSIEQVVTALYFVVRPRKARSPGLFFHQKPREPSGFGRFFPVLPSTLSGGRLAYGNIHPAAL
jgi:hypothetical protein